VFIGVTTFHTIVGSFIGGLPSIVAVVMNLRAPLGDAR